MQTRGDLVTTATELAAGVQHGHHHLERGFLQLRLQVDGDAAAVVSHRDGAVGVDDHLDEVVVAGQRLVDGVVDELVDHVVQAVDIGVADVHAWPPPHGFEAFENLDVRAGVVGRGREVMSVGVLVVFGLFERFVR